MFLVLRLFSAQEREDRCDGRREENFGERCEQEEDRGGQRERDEREHEKDHADLPGMERRRRPFFVFGRRRPKRAPSRIMMSSAQNTVWTSDEIRSPTVSAVMPPVRMYRSDGLPPA